MAIDLPAQYSGIVLNQNASPTGSYDWRGAGAPWVYQTFTFPSDYARGTDTQEIRIPDLSGFQVMVSIDFTFAFTASLDYTLTYFTGDNDGWLPVTSGTVIGSHSDGTQVWFDIILPESVPITEELLSTQWRLGLKTRTASDAAFKQPVIDNGDGSYTIGSETYAPTLTPNVPYPITVQGDPAFLYLDDLAVTYSIQQGISTLWYVQPTPLTHDSISQGQAYQADTLTPFLGGNSTSSLNFRLLSLVADSGVDFLGNEYRSFVALADGGNTDTTAGLNPVEGSGQGQFWMSPPMPSRFAVQSLYFDVRPTAAAPLQGLLNLVGNPSFEWDKVGQAPHWWSPFNNGVSTVVDQTVQSFWSFDRSQSLHLKYTFTNSSTQSAGILSPYYGIEPTVGGLPSVLAASLAYDLVTATNSKLVLSMVFYDINQVLLPQPYGTVSQVVTSVGTGVTSELVTMPADAAFVRFLVGGFPLTNSASFEAYIDAIQVTQTPVVEPYFDGDDINVEWTGQRGQSTSVQMIDAVPSDNLSVIDSVLLDPITPNMSFNVYYSQDNAHTNLAMTESDWEQKLWVHVPRSYIATQRQQYAFPEPIRAKYVKVEFSNLQPQTFNPGAFQKPVAYKKFPTWVASFFIGLLDPPSFAASQVNVQYDALSFAYQYFLDDLGQAPDAPVAVPDSTVAQLTNYFSAPATGVDPGTLARINLIMKTYQNVPGSLVGNTTALGALVDTLVTNLQLFGSANPPAATTEGMQLAPVDYSTVSSLQREPVLLEQSMPIMYFFLTCRHGYKEALASFSHNRAFFAGVKQISLVRNDYTVESDTPLYIETGGDPVNILATDFVLDDDNTWHVY